MSRLRFFKLALVFVVLRCARRSSCRKPFRNAGIEPARSGESKVQLVALRETHQPGTGGADPGNNRGACTVREHAVVAGEIHPWAGHQRGQASRKIQRFVHNVCGVVVVVFRPGLAPECEGILYSPDSFTRGENA